MENIKILNNIMNNLKTEVKLADLTRKDFKGNDGDSKYYRFFCTSWKR